MEVRESLAAQRGGPRGPCNAKPTSSLQPLKKTIVYVFINCVPCYGCLELPICFYTPTPTHTQRGTNNPPLHPFPLDRVHGMGSGLGGNEVTRTHPHACKNTLTATRHPGFCSPGYFSLPTPLRANLSPPFKAENIWSRRLPWRPPRCWPLISWQWSNEIRKRRDKIAERTVAASGWWRWWRGSVVGGGLGAKQGIEKRRRWALLRCSGTHSHTSMQLTGVCYFSPKDWVILTC